LEVDLNMEEAMATKLAGRRRLRAALVSGGLLAGVVAMSGPAHGVAEPVAAGLQAYSQGSTFHVAGLQTADVGPKVADTDVAMSSTAVNSAGLATAVNSETGEPIVPAKPGKSAYGRGTGLALGLGTDVPNTPEGRDLLLGGLSEAAAQPPDPNGTDPSPAAIPKASGPYQTGIVQNDLVDVPGDPLAYAGTLRGQAQALWNPLYAMPTLGSPLAFGLGYAADVRLLDVGTANPDGTFPGLINVATPEAGAERAASQAFSLTYLVNNGDGTCGIANEIHQTIAPVSLNLPPDNDPLNDIVIEVAGEWVLKTVVTGKPGGASISYTPGDVASPATPLLSILPGDGTVTRILSTQDLFDVGGLNVPLAPLADVTVGEAPRGIGPANGVPTFDSPPIKTDTHVATAVDVVRIAGIVPSAPAAGFEGADLRIGHFESSLTVPAGGINCEIPVRKTADTATVGETFNFRITIPVDKDALVPFPCDLTNIKVTDTVSVKKSDTPNKPVLVELTGGSSPNGSKVTISPDKHQLTFENIGNYHPGDPPIILTVTARIPPGSGQGLINNDALATATAGNCKPVKGSVIEELNGFTGTAAVGGLTGTFAGSFFGKDGAGLTAKVGGGGAVNVIGHGVANDVPVISGRVLAVTGRNDTLFLGLALGALTSTLVLVRLRRRVTASG
jgi:hypothetical protein